MNNIDNFHDIIFVTDKSGRRKQFSAQEIGETQDITADQIIKNS